MANTKEIQIVCPVCEEDTIITEKEIKLAIQHKAETGGNVLVHCTECCRALVMPEDIPEGDPELKQWIIEASEDPEDCCRCIPMLDATQEQIPNGSYADLGVTFYRPGDGSKAMKKRPYMFKFGLDPSCYLSKNPSMGGKPFVVGGKK